MWKYLFLLLKFNKYPHAHRNLVYLYTLCLFVHVENWSIYKHYVNLLHSYILLTKHYTIFLSIFICSNTSSLHVILEDIYINVDLNYTRVTGDVITRDKTEYYIQALAEGVDRKRKNDWRLITIFSTGK